MSSFSQKNSGVAEYLGWDTVRSDTETITCQLLSVHCKVKETHRKGRPFSRVGPLLLQSFDVFFQFFRLFSHACHKFATNPGFSPGYFHSTSPLESLCSSVCPEFTWNHKPCPKKVTIHGTPMFWPWHNINLRQSHCYKPFLPAPSCCVAVLRLPGVACEPPEQIWNDQAVPSLYLYHQGHHSLIFTIRGSVIVYLAKIISAIKRPDNPTILPIIRKSGWSGTEKEEKTKEMVEGRVNHFKSCMWRVVCEKAVCVKELCVKSCEWKSCVWKIVSERVVCERLSVAKLCVKELCMTKLFLTKLCVKDCVCVWQSCVWKSCVWQSCFWQSCVWKIVCVCVTKLCVKELCVCVTKLCVTKLCNKELCVTKLCVKELCVTKLCVCDKVVCVTKLCVTKLCDKDVCVWDKVVCDTVVWQRCVWERSCMWERCVCVCERLCVTKLCVRELCMKKLCAKELHLTKLCAIKLHMEKRCDRLCVTKLRVTKSYLKEMDSLEAWMPPSATPATQNEGGCRQVPRLPRLPAQCHVHLNFQMCSEPVSFSHFWLPNVLRTTTACTFSTSQLVKVLRRWCLLCILTSTYASRHNGVQFFISHLGRWLRTRRFSEPTFRPSGATNRWKNTVFRDFPTFSRTCIFFLLTHSLLWSSLLCSSLLWLLPPLLFHLSILSEVWLLSFLRSWRYYGDIIGILLG